MILTTIVFFIILSILVFIHELGHYLVARWVGVSVEEFGFGLPPRIVGRKIGETVYSLNWLPVGGFVKLAGEDEEERKTENGKRKNNQELFWARSKKERSAILLAGVTMNFLLAVGITTVLLTQGVKEPAGRVHIESVVPGSPAQQSGLRESDLIKFIQFRQFDQYKSQPITTTRELIEITRAHAGEEITLTVVREGKEFLVTLVPRQAPPAGQGPMGVAISELETRKYLWSVAPGRALAINFSRAAAMLSSIGVTLWRFITLQPLQADVAGPIGIAQVTGQAVKFGFSAVLEFMSILSLNLAVLNILPIPALDGGRLAFVFLEKLVGKRIRPAFERSAHQVGMIILLFLILLVSINDILRLARG